MTQLLSQLAIPALIAILFAVSAFLFALSLIPSKSILTRQLEVLQQQTPTASEQQRLAMFEKMFSPEGKASVAKRLMEAGWYTVTPAQMMLRVVASGVLGVIADILLWRFVNVGPIVDSAMLLIVPIALAYAPMWFLSAAADARKIAVQKAMPDFLDMVATTVQAGLSVNAALGYAIDAAPGPLGEEMREVLSQVRLGRARSDALKAASDRLNQPEFRTAITAINQAEKLGANLAQVLGELAEDVRNHRAMIVEENAAKLPVKMVFPMAFFMLPTLFVIIFGTIAANYFQNVAR
jgi:tight adherence protein C